MATLHRHCTSYANVLRGDLVTHHYIPQRHPPIYFTQTITLVLAPLRVPYFLHDLCLPVVRRYALLYKQES